MLALPSTSICPNQLIRPETGSAQSNTSALSSSCHITAHCERTGQRQCCPGLGCTAFNACLSLTKKDMGIHLAWESSTLPWTTNAHASRRWERNPESMEEPKTWRKCKRVPS
ncbi:Uncharacterized protein DAT39_000084 [Clarias magur]|uniref:Uncharacterized protein n=1 Tax=Clarias magur TaxID=1594786 RepID=A0A8J5C980_CLAMG|nr:Uncharacterized protein DAT39_000084 [Clarias magur]